MVFALQLEWRTVRRQQVSCYYIRSSVALVLAHGNNYVVHVRFCLLSATLLARSPLPCNHRSTRTRLYRCTLQVIRNATPLAIIATKQAIR